MGRVAPRGDAAGPAVFARIDPTALRIALIYTLVSSAWIVSSDWILGGWLIGDERTLLFFQNAKGAFFAVATGLALYFAIAAALARQRRLSREKERVEQMLANSQRLEAIGHHAATVVHDFNNLILVVRGLTQLAREETNVPARVTEHLAQIEGAAVRAEEVVRQLARFLRQKPAGLAPLDLVAVVRDFLPLLQQVLTRAITFTADLAPSVSPVIADRSQVEQVLLNLAINARDALEGRAHKRVILSLRTVTLDGHRSAWQTEPVSGAFVLISVEDSGCGIPEGHLPHIFEPFFTTKPEGKGTGLGLATAFRVMQQAGGWVEVASREGAGTRFALYFPAGS